MNTTMTQELPLNQEAAKPAETTAVAKKTATQPPAAPSAGKVNAKAALTECKVLTKLSQEGEGSILQLITNMTGDPDYAKKFITWAKIQIRNAWKMEGGKPFNPFNEVPMESVFEELFEGARRRVLPDGYNAHLVVYLGKNPRVQLLVDFKGLCDVAYSEGLALNINAKEVRENDEIELEWGEVSKFKIDPKKPRGNVIGCIAFADLPTGRRHSIYMSLEELEQVHACAQTEEIWGTWLVEMYKKTAIRRMFKTMQNTPKFTALLELDNRSFDLNKASYQVKKKTSGDESPVRPITGSAPVALPPPSVESEGAFVEGQDEGSVFE